MDIGMQLWKFDCTLLGLQEILRLFNLNIPSSSKSFLRPGRTHRRSILERPG